MNDVKKELQELKRIAEENPELADAALEASDTLNALSRLADDSAEEIRRDKILGVFSAISELNPREIELINSAGFQSDELGSAIEVDIRVRSFIEQ